MTAEPIASEKELARWASEQAPRIPSYIRNLEGQAECAMQIAALGGDVGSLPIAGLKGSWLNTEQVTEWAAMHRIVYMLNSYHAAKCVELKDNVLIEAAGFEPLVEISIGDPRWLKRLDNKPPSRRHPIVEAVAKAWFVAPDAVEVWSGEYEVGHDSFGNYYPIDASLLKLESVEID